MQHLQGLCGSQSLCPSLAFRTAAPCWPVKMAARASTTLSNDVARCKPLLRGLRTMAVHPRSEQLLPAALTAAFCSSQKSFSRVLSPSPPGAGGAVQLPGVLPVGKSLPLALWLLCPPWDGLSPLSPASVARAEGAGCPWMRGPGKQVTPTGSSGSLRDSAEACAVPRGSFGCLPASSASRPARLQPRGGATRGGMRPAPPPPAPRGPPAGCKHPAGASHNVATSLPLHSPLRMGLCASGWGFLLD